MKNGCIVTLGVLFLIIVIVKCTNTVIENNKKEKIEIVEKQQKAKQDSINAIKKAKQDSINAIKVKELAQYFTKTYDEFVSTEWVEPKTKPKYVNQNGYCMYFAIDNGVPNNPRFRIQYEADDWLFITHMIFNIDGENTTFIPEEMETDCGNGGRIWEWCDESALELEPLIKKIAYAKSVKIKMVGKQYHDIKTMSPKQIQYFRYSYEYYKALGGTFD